MDKLISQQAAIDAVSNCGICVQRIVDLPSIDAVNRQEAIDKLKKRLFETAFNNIGIKQNIDETLVDVAENRLENWFNDVPSVQPESTRTFVELVAKYPDPELCTYKEYKGKPYYSIKYVENGETYIGYGTYNPEVLSQYLKEYFILSAQPERKKGTWTDDASCPFCKFQPWYERDIHTLSFCPNCGADMRGQNDPETF